ncbi:alpha/beta fold hydrolase [Bifidobacterium sp. 82T24]|uniref:esterase/lipase family protein n=1 Tax=Bifidobacterium pluvialisilvae TaxID=2834436 RepID=UPI001C586707|nr:alpha/beta hydrolase-fold protein [Bifidobacterium pluvialisilvae]MBW3087146.1 alpha/beta fold hydrolase [Bifidobacterium pluvialisilvae]
MNAHVKSRIYGGQGTSTKADLECFRAVSSALNNASIAVWHLHADWSATPIQLAQKKRQAPFCPKLNGSATAGDVMDDGSCVAGGPDGDTAVHMSLNYPAVNRHANERGDQANALREKLSLLADHIIRAYSLYSNAEWAAERLMNEALQAGALGLPGYAGALFGAYTVVEVVDGSLTEGRFNPMYALTDTWWAQEGLLAALGTAMTKGTDRRAILQGAVDVDEVNEAAEEIAKFSAPLNDAIFGDKLTVTRARPLHGIGETRTIADSLRNVHDMRLNKVDYGTIAIQKYLRDDGSTAWMVTIPGTDGNPDSPFSWPTNVELMSSDAERRKAADSARMVDEAMRRAGIAPEDPVAIVGHSQGGIVAATMAADYGDRYNIQHIVTAGSPIANHPIDRKRTWVTSIEMNDELVSNLDGSRNPVSPTWLTVRGISQPMGSDDGTAVENTDDHKFLTHDMNYMKAAWKDAEELGSTAQQGHERHFQEVIDGRHTETTYWRGRISR